MERYLQEVQEHQTVVNPVILAHQPHLGPLMLRSSTVALLLVPLKCILALLHVWLQKFALVLCDLAIDVNGKEEHTSGDCGAHKAEAEA